MNIRSHYKSTNAKWSISLNIKKIIRIKNHNRKNSLPSILNLKIGTIIKTQTNQFMKKIRNCKSKLLKILRKATIIMMIITVKLCLYQNQKVRHKFKTKKIMMAVMKIMDLEKMDSIEFKAKPNFNAIMLPNLTIITMGLKNSNIPKIIKNKKIKKDKCNTEEVSQTLINTTKYQMI